ncbi:MAG: OmpA family protein [Deltaproteobacteria bacterium]|nr:OmpA family protein [Deltaproteobacteria bacterium]
MKGKFYKVALLLVLASVAACAPAGRKTAIGTAAGTALGAGMGAIIGSATGDIGPGIAIGAATGALAGAATGNKLDAVDQENALKRDRLASQQAIIEENRRLIEELRRRGADVRGSRRGVVINLPDVLFEFDRHSLTSYAGRTIGEIATVLRDVRDRQIAVEGHTDSIGTVTYNHDLSLRRARSVASELARNGIPSGQMRVKGFGEGSPIATNNTDDGRARNRRVEVIIEN